ncbi:MAG TPA: 50S ribosomal protein L23 [Candidatus Saccharimonadales bacterium]|nr:50S ribosomal protein L23 [Candidatus Saccharimonadales bacterium]
MKLNNIIEKPIITEKSTQDAEKGKYTFKVKLDASKGAIANEVKNVFNVDVVDVHTIILMGKRRRLFNRRETMKLPNWKKAIVTLKPGQKLELFANEGNKS